VLIEPTTAVERLQQLEALSDAGLAHLSVEQMLTQLLDQARDFLRADTAAVLMMDPSSQHLVATAARGIEEEVSQGVRIPLGQGFAGRVATTKSAVAIDHVSAATVFNPILIDKGIRSLLGVPLIATGNVLGVLHVGTLTTRRFREDDARLLQMIADRVALALQVGMTDRDHTAAQVLQRSLLPPARLPELPGLELAARYVPGDAGAVGGDWYDTFVLPSGALCLVVGDVVGHGLEAAHAMGRARSALRSYALETEQPADILTRLDRQISYFHPGLMTTVLCAVLEPGHDRMHLSTAGHPPPVLAASDDPRAQVLDLPADAPVGIPSVMRVGRPRRTTSIAIPPGTVVCCYTDGLIERRGESLDDGLQALSEAIASVTGTPAISTTAEAVCARVMAQLIGAHTPQDDVAIVTLYRHPNLDRR
jgi:serine phosphatase RsbU (regulator of sigma subunit)